MKQLDLLDKNYMEYLKENNIRIDPVKQITSEQEDEEEM